MTASESKASGTAQDGATVRAWESWKQAYRYCRESRPPVGSHWSQKTAAGWKAAENAIWDERDSLK